ncbi:unnamed protein product [Oncorhynchus mykiss]|uniref:SAM domain-containing protein n=1 Tax=Oncorhynchus mykiss TaxID=8022 RepID=A0A060YPV2_ONCMY|nr:unnamed protein product [Oncorhynchus mykiss]
MKHLAISKWLSQLGLPQYCTLFDEEYDGVEVRAELSLIPHAETYAQASTNRHTDSTHTNAYTLKRTHIDTKENTHSLLMKQISGKDYQSTAVCLK